MEVLINSYFVNIFKNETEKAYSTSLHHIMNNIDNNISQINILTETISTDPKFTPFNIDLYPQNWIETVDSLKKYSISNTIISEMYVFFDNGSKIYSSHGTFNYDTFGQAMQNKYGSSLTDIGNVIDNSKRGIKPPGKELKVKGSKSNLIFFFRPILHGNIAYVVEEEKLRSYVNSSFSNYKSNTIILNSFNEMIISQDINSTVDKELLDNIIKLKESGNKDVVLHKDKYFLCYSKSSRTGWTYITLIPVSNVLKEVNTVQLVSYISIFIISIVCFIIIYYLMKVNYNPIKRLVNIFHEKSAINMKSEDEIIAIQKAMDSIFDANRKARELIEKNKIAFKEYLLLCLLKGKIRNVEEFNNLGHEYGIYFTRKSYIVAYFLFHNLCEHKFSKENIVDIIENQLYEKYEGYCKDDINDNSIYLILGIDDNSNAVKESIDELIKILNRDFELKCTVGIGREYGSLDGITRSYIEANIAMDYRIMLGINKAITYGEAKLIKKESDWYPDKEISEIRKNLYLGNFNNVSGIINSIIANIKNYKLSPFMIKSTLFEITNAVIKVLYELNIYHDFEGEKIIDVVELSKYNSFEEILPVLSSFCSELCVKIKEKKESQNSELIEKIIIYIQENCCSSDISLQSIGTYFNVSTSYLSRYFKDQTGSTVLQYITDLRIKKSKELLLSTDLQINCIVEKVGFLDVTSFSRWFKQQTGLSPGKFRQEQKNS